MEKTLQFGLNFLDPHFKELPSCGIYLFIEDKTTVRFSFIYHLLCQNISVKNSCLYITNNELSRESEIIHKKIMKLNKHELFLTMLETPMYIKELINDTIFLQRVLDDLKKYVDAVRPSLIVLECIDLLLNNDVEVSDFSFLSQILNFFSELNVAVVIDISELDQKDKYFCEKYASGVFEFSKPDKKENYQLKTSKCKNLKGELVFMFTVDASLNIISPLFKNTVITALHDCKQVVMISEFRIYEQYFVEIFGHSMEFRYYNSLQNLIRLIDTKIDNKYTLIIIPAFASEVCGWQILSEVRRAYPFSRILFTDSENISPHQKVKAIKLGACRFIDYPFDKAGLYRILCEMYQYEGDEKDKYLQHKILYVNEDFLKGQKSKVLFKSSLASYIKEYAFNFISKGLSMHFYKLYTNKNSYNDLLDIIKISPQLIFISSYFIGERQAVLMIYKNLYINQLKSFTQQIALALKRMNQATENSKSTSLLDKLSKNILSNQDAEKNEIKCINYPLDETDIDNILEWIYHSV